MTVGPRLGALIRDERGVTLVEFALVVPVLILVLVTCLDFARALNAYVTVANASREGARYATTYSGPDASAIPAIKAAVASRAAPLDPAALTVTISYLDSNGAYLDWPPPRGNPAPSPVVIHVDVRYPWSAATWLAGSFFSATGPSTIASSSSMETVR